MKHGLTSLSLIGLTLLAASGQAASIPDQQADQGTVAAVETPAPSEDQGFDDVVFAPYPEFVGRAFMEQFRTRQLSESIETALNSDGDELKLDLYGELYVPNPAFPGTSLGGNVDLEVTLSLHVAEGQPVYELKARGSGLAGLQASAGLAGASLGASDAGAVMWKFPSQQELTQALQGLVLRVAVGDRAQRAVEELNKRIGVVDVAIRQTQAVRNQFVGWLARFLPGWVIQRIDSLTTSRSRLIQSLNQVRALATMVQTCDAKLRDRPIFVEFELGLEASASMGVELLKGAGDSSLLGIGGEISFEPNMSALVEVRGGVPQRADLAMHIKNAGSMKAGRFVSGTVNLEVELVVSGSGTFTTSGFEVDSVNDRVELSVDRSYSTSGSVGVGALYGAGRTTVASIDLSELVSIGKEGIDALLSGDPSVAAVLLGTLPATFEGQARIERAAALGGVLQVGEKFSSIGLIASAWWTDQGATASGVPSVAALTELFTLEEAAEQVQATKDVLSGVAVELGVSPAP
jgi:hypothetical protein